MRNVVQRDNFDGTSARELTRKQLRSTLHEAIFPRWQHHFRPNPRYLISLLVNFILFFSLLLLSLSLSLSFLTTRR